MPRSALVIGGGIGGLAAAIALRAAGIEATVCERSHRFREVGAGIVLWPNATRALERLGLLDAVRAAAEPVLAVEIRRPDGRPLTRVDAAGYPTPSLCVHRAELIDALRGALPAEAVVLDCAWTGLVDHGDRVTAHFADGSERSADVLVVADGLRSAVRADRVGAVAPAFCRQTVVRGVAPEGTRPAEAFEAWGDRLRFGRFGLGRDRTYWYAVEAADRPPETPPVDGAALRDRFRSWHASIRALVEATPSETLTRYGVFDRPPARGWARGRTVLVGDAAHPMTPDLGQGGAMALEDAVALAAALAGGTREGEALRRFERMRTPRTARLARQSRLAGRLGQAGGAARLRDVAVALAPDAAFARAFAWAFG